MIWPWLLFDYYHPKSPKSRFAQCFQWFCNHSEKTNILAKNRITLENTALYPDAPEDSERRHCSCQALSLCKKQDANSNAWACVLLLPVPAVPLWHIVYLWGETVETSGLFALISFLVQLDGCGRGIWTTYNRGGNRNFIEITGVLLAFLVLKNTVFRWPKIKVGTKVGTEASIYLGPSLCLPQKNRFCLMWAKIGRASCRERV